MSVPEQTLPVPAPVPVAGPGGSRPARAVPSWREAGLHLAVLALAGVLLGLLWRALVPVLVSLSDGVERQVAGDVTMAGLGLLAGALVAAVGLVRSGPGATTRFGLSVFGSGLGSVLAWQVGRLVGAPPVGILGVLLIWPFVLATVTVTATLVTTLLASDSYR